jgi:hypothetical protein
VQTYGLNLASRPFRNNTLPWLAFTVTAAVLAVLTVSNVRSYREHRVLADDLRGNMSSAAAEFAELAQRESAANRGIARYPVDRLRVRAGKANDAIRWKAFSWTRLFNQLQHVLPWDVQLTAIRPVFRDPRRRKADATLPETSVPVYVEGVAKTLEDFTEFERALFEDPHFDRVEPDGYEKDEVTDETLFRLRFLYDPEPEAPGETAPAAPEAAEATEGEAVPSPGPETGDTAELQRIDE